MWGPYGYGSPGVMGGWGFIGLAAMLIFWVLIIVGIVLIVRWLAMGARPGMHMGPGMQMGPGAPMGMAPNASALQILSERYAKGEITKEQYDQMKRDIGA